MGNVYSDNLEDNIELNDMGYLLALTGNPEIDRFATKNFGPQFGEHGTFRVRGQDEMPGQNGEITEQLISNADDFSKLTEISLNYPTIREIKLADNAHFRKLISMTRENEDRSSLFLKSADGRLELISTIDLEEIDIQKNQHLVYIGKVIHPDDLVGQKEKSTS